MRKKNLDKRKFAILSIVSILLCLIIACQSTPNDVVVVGKGKEQLKEMVDKSNSQNSEVENDNIYKVLEYDAPKKLDYTLKQNKATVIVDADIHLPKYVLPIQSMNKANIEYEAIVNLLELLEIDNELLYNMSFAMNARTKKHIEYEIQSSLDYAEPDEDNTVWLEELYKQLENAPASLKEVAEETNNPEGNPVDLNESNFNKERYALVIGEETPLFPSLSLSVEPNTTNQYVEFRAIESLDQRISSRDLALFNNMDLTQEQAMQQAQKVVDAIDDSLTLATVGVAMMPEFLDYTYSGEKEYEYMFVFTRDYNGVNNTHIKFPDIEWRHAMTLQQQGKEYTDLNPLTPYASPITQEHLRIGVRESGITVVEYYSPMTKGELLAKESQLLSFEKIKEIFDKHIVLMGFDSAEKVTMEIHNIRLGMMVIKNQDNSNDYTAIPVWDFFGNYEIEGKLSMMQTKHVYESYLTINAVDGSIINRYLGY